MWILLSWIYELYAKTFVRLYQLIINNVLSEYNDVNEEILLGDDFMSEMHSRQSGFTWKAF